MITLTHTANSATTDVAQVTTLGYSEPRTAKGCHRIGVREAHVGGKMTQERIKPELVAVMLDRSPRTLARWGKQGIGPRRYSDGYRNFYLRHEVEAFYASQTD